MDLKVTFLPEGIEVSALPGLTLLELARRANIGITALCGGRGTCGKCQVQVWPAPEPTPVEKKNISAQRLREGFRLACQTRVNLQDLRVMVPSEFRFFNLKTMVSGIIRDVQLRTSLHKYYLELPPPTIEDQRPDWERLKSALSSLSGLPKEEITTNIYLLRNLPEKLRKSNFRITAVLEGKRLISVEPGDTSRSCFGVACDLGTTTIVGALIDIRKAKELGVASRLNPQSAYGADVITRINYTIGEKAGGKILQQEAVSTINEIIAELCEKSGNCQAENIYEVSVVGNTAMEHLLLGLPAASLVTSPYVGVYRNSLCLSAKKLGIKVNEDALVYVGPLISGFIGGDTVAGIMATNIHHEEPLRLFIDIGTNGEIVVGNKEGLWCASTAAGPAFEGANIHFGMRAQPGAIDKVIISDQIHYTTIGEKFPLGICGTGLVEAVSELRRCGVITADGRIKKGSQAEGLPKEIRERIVEDQEGLRFVLVPENGVAIFQKDIRQLQLAKAAIAAGISVLLSKISLSLSDLDEILLAGAFGSYIEPKAALRLGLLPPVPVEKIRFVGNTALTGSKMMLLSEEMKREADKIPTVCRYIELFHEKNFIDLFVDNLSFPPQDLL